MKNLIQNTKRTLTHQRSAENYSRSTLVIPSRKRLIDIHNDANVEPDRPKSVRFFALLTDSRYLPTESGVIFQSLPRHICSPNIFRRCDWYLCFGKTGHAHIDHCPEVEAICPTSQPRQRKNPKAPRKPAQPEKICVCFSTNDFVMRRDDWHQRSQFLFQQKKNPSREFNCVHVCSWYEWQKNWAHQKKV